MSDERLAILKMVETGDISTEDALQLIDALNQTEQVNEMQLEQERELPPANVPENENLWLIPTAAGAVVMAIGAPLVALGLSRRVSVFWSICCGWLPFLTGLAFITIGVWSRSARWLHLRIRNAHSGRPKIALSFPLPLTLAAWIMQLIRPFVPQLNDIAVEEMILALRDGWRDGDDQPITIKVQDDDDDEQVMITIG